MLNVYFGEIDDALYSGNGYFDNWIDDECLETEFAGRIIKEIDKSERVSKNLIQSPVIGAVPPKYLSGGTKALLILMYSDKIVDISAFGKNCYKFIAEISNFKDITITASMLFNIFDYGNIDRVHVLNDDTMVYSNEELLNKYLKFR